MAFRSRIRDVDFSENPSIFLIGHWRSGTTHLHNLLSRDPRFGFLTFGETAMPNDMLGPMLPFGKKMIDRALPETRGTDNVRLTLAEPQEEEMGLGNLQRIGYYGVYHFPQEMQTVRDESLFFEGVSSRVKKKFFDRYELLIRKLAVARPGKQLLLKNPPSTCRVSEIRKRFPNAKFVHIVRNPWPVYASTVAKFPRLYNAFAWQTFQDVDIPPFVVETYERLMKGYLEEQASLGLSETDLVEVRYEDLTDRPLEEIERIYQQLRIPFTDEAQSEISSYLKSLSGYQKNRHKLTQREVDAVQRHWSFAFDHWGYDVDPSSSVEIVAE